MGFVQVEHASTMKQPFQNTVMIGVEVKDPVTRCV